MAPANGVVPATLRFQHTTAWSEINTEDANDLLTFWKREGANPDATQTKARLKQMVRLARVADGGVAEVCTALPIDPPHSWLAAQCFSPTIAGMARL